MIASEILSQTKIKKRSDVASCLLLTTILLEVSVVLKNKINLTIMKLFLIVSVDSKSFNLLHYVCSMFSCPRDTYLKW